MADRARSDLIKEALYELNVAEAGQPVPAEVAARVDSKLDNILETLAERGVTLVSNTETIPGAQFNPLAIIVAKECAGSFGIAGAELGDLIVRCTDAERTLREVTRAGVGTGYGPQQTSYF